MLAIVLNLMHLFFQNLLFVSKKSSHSRFVEHSALLGMSLKSSSDEGNRYEIANIESLHPTEKSPFLRSGGRFGDR